MTRSQTLLAALFAVVAVAVAAGTATTPSGTAASRGLREHPLPQGRQALGGEPGRPSEAADPARGPVRTPRRPTTARSSRCAALDLYRLNRSRQAR